MPVDLSGCIAIFMAGVTFALLCTLIGSFLYSYLMAIRKVFWG